MASASVQATEIPKQNDGGCIAHNEPEKPEVYEPPDLIGRKHVEKIAGEYRVREDECLADKLQHEEFELHFGKNKVDRKLFHIDLKTAKEIYLKEVEDSGMLSKQELTKLCADDVFLAAEIEQRLSENKELEVQSKAAVELQDEEFAKYLQIKEKQKLDFERKERLRQHLEQDRQTARRLQREFDAQAQAHNEEVLNKGMLVVDTSPSKQKLRQQSYSIDCEIGSTHGKNTKEELRALNAKEQKRMEEERDFKIAMKLQRAEAEQFQRAKREQQFRRAQSERHNHDAVNTDRRRHLQYNKDDGAVPIRTGAPPDESRYVSLDLQNREIHSNSTSRNINQNKKVLQSVDATGKPILDKSATHDSLHQNVNIPRSHLSYNDVAGRPVNKGSSQNNNKLRSDRVDSVATSRPVLTKSKTEDSTYNVKIPRSYQTELNATDKLALTKGMSLDSPYDIPRAYQTDAQKPPKENIYLKPVDSIGIGDGTTRDHVKTKNSNSVRKKQTSLDCQDSWGIEITNGSHAKVTEQQPVNHGEEYRNVAAAIDPTYTTINHLSPQHTPLGPTPLVQNVKRSTHQEAEKRKKKWFSKKEK